MAECDACGLAAYDLPDGVDPELVFQWESLSGDVLCPSCASIRAGGDGLSVADIASQGGQTSERCPACGSAKAPTGKCSAGCGWGV